MVQSFTEFLNESSLSRVLAHTQGRNIGIITAHRGNLPASENNKRNASLKADIRKHGLGFIKVKGTYIENKGEPTEKHVAEHSFLVVGKKGEDNGHLHGFLKKHGEKYEQDSVLHKAHNSDEAHLVGTKKTGTWPKYGEHESVGKFHPNKISDYKTLMKHSGRSFSFSEQNEIEVLDKDYVNEGFYNDKSWFSREETEF